ncbi:hypothetical protein HMPREF1301_00226 [Propionibacterium sp. KPL2005]|nr:hypothetical protein HMPREF1301_00226 [Propionibacterium sp. KPL2005]ERS26740.1 hypothetical protein HMPREF1297_02330 [Propionibacterium sp. KPL2000]
MPGTEQDQQQSDEKLTPAQADADQKTEEKPDQPQGGTDWKAEARKWEERAKANKSELDKLAQESTKGLSDVEKLTRANGELKAEVEALRLDQLRRDVAAEKGLAHEACQFLSGSTREELEKSADVLSRLIGSQQRQMKRLAGQPPEDNPELTEARDFVDALASRK